MYPTLCFLFHHQRFQNERTGMYLCHAPTIKLPSLQDRCCHLRLTFLYPVIKGTVLVVPANSFLTSQRANKWHIQLRHFTDCTCSNSVERSATKYSVFPCPSSQHRPNQELLFCSNNSRLEPHLNNHQVRAEPPCGILLPDKCCAHTSPHSYPITIVVTFGYCGVQIQFEIQSKEKKPFCGEKQKG